MHNWNIELDSGCASAPDEGCVRTFPVKVEGGEIMVDLGHAAAATRKPAREGVRDEAREGERGALG